VADFSRFGAEITDLLPGGGSTLADLTQSGAHFSS
jgi:hypothetical protein